MGLVVLVGMGQVWGQEPAPEKTILNNRSSWRQYYVLMGMVVRKGEGVEPVKLMSGGKEVGQWLGMDTALPAAGWQGNDFNDVGWNRKPIADPDSPWIGLLCMRGRFKVEDPAKVEEMKLTVKYRGGVVAYLNGKEIGRGSLKAGAGPKDLADDYPNEDLKQSRELTEMEIPAGLLRERRGREKRFSVAAILEVRRFR